MGRSNKNTVKQLLDEWAKLSAKARRIETERDRKLQPLREEYEKATEPITNEAAQKLQPLREQINEIETEITRLMKAMTGPDGEIPVSQVSTEGALAEITASHQREIEPEMFFQETPPAKRNPAFWSCVKIQIGKAEKFLGSRIDELAEIKRNFKVSIRLK